MKIGRRRERLSGLYERASSFEAKDNSIHKASRQLPENRIMSFVSRMEIRSVNPNRGDLNFTSNRL
jgi:hypothetical protein